MWGSAAWGEVPNAEAGVASYYGAASLVASGTLEAAGTASYEGSATLAAAGTLTAAGTASYEGSAILTASGVLEAAGTASYEGSAVLTAAGTLTAEGLATYEGSAVLTATGTLTAAGTFVGVDIPTMNLRMSAVATLGPSMRLAPASDGATDQADEQHLAGVYRGVDAQSVTPDANVMNVRMSALATLGPPLRLAPVPVGSLDQYDRQQVSGTYRAILAGDPAPEFFGAATFTASGILTAAGSFTEPGTSGGVFAPPIFASPVFARGGIFA